jgi:hypothetical protein
MSASLSNKRSHLVPFNDLVNLPEPRQLGAVHQPIPHNLLARALRVEAAERGYQVTREQFAVASGGEKLFGVIDLMPEGVVSAEVVAAEDRGLSLGFRNSTNSTLALKMVAGSRVFVCDNLVMSGDLIAVLRRNTVGLDLEDALRAGFDKFLQHATSLDRHVARLQAQTILDLEAKARIFDVFAARVVPVHLFDEVNRYYFAPADEMTDCQPRTLWGLHNAFTRAMKTLPPARTFAATVALGRQFGMVEENQ